MKTRLFLALSILSTVAIGVLAWILLTFFQKQHRANFENRYTLTIDNLKETLITLETDADQIAKNAVIAFQEIEAKYGLPKAPEFAYLKNKFGVVNFFAGRENGDLFFSTNGNTLANGGLTGLNFFQMCPGYRELLTSDRIEQTPIIYNPREMDTTDAFKYTMVGSKDRTKILEVSVSVQTILDRVTGVFKTDQNIKRISLFSSNGTILISAPNKPASFPESVFFTNLKPNKSFLKWIGNDLLVLSKFQPSTNSGQCCECTQKRLSSEEQYYYILSALVSTHAFEGAAHSTYLRVIGVLLFCLIGILVLSQQLAKNLAQPLGHIFQQLREKSKSNETASKLNLPPKATPEVTQIVSEYNKLIENTETLHRKQLASEIEKVKSEQIAKSETEKATALRINASLIRHDIIQVTSSMRMNLEIHSHRIPDDFAANQRHSLNRIDDIANSFFSTANSEKQTSHMLFSLIHMILSEIRVRYSDKRSVQIDYSTSPQAHCLFAKGAAVDLLRALRNLMENSIESFSGVGKIVVTLDEEDSFARIEIKDNGKGIPKHVLPCIFERGFSYGKEKNRSKERGLGLSQAKFGIEKWNGQITASSEETQGTTMTIRIPKATPPSWFVSQIIIAPGTVIAIVDDNDYLHGYFERLIPELSKKHGCSLIHFYRAVDFENWLKHSKGKDVIFFVDHNLEGSQVTGLKLIKEYGIERSTFLTTHRWDEEEIQAQCIQNHIGLIPKSCIANTPIITSVCATKYDAVIIDNDLNILSLLTKKAKRESISILTFTSISAFLRESKFISRDSSIYIDSDLGCETRGELQAQTIFQQGFAQIYSIACNRAFRDYPWIKGHRSKENPWKSTI